MAAQHAGSARRPTFVEHEFLGFLACGVLPRVPVRQWVLSLPCRVRYLLAWNDDLWRDVFGVYARALPISGAATTQDRVVSSP